MTHHKFVVPIFSIATHPKLQLLKKKIIYWIHSFGNFKRTLGKWVNYVNVVELPLKGSVKKRYIREVISILIVILTCKI